MASALIVHRPNGPRGGGTSLTFTNVTTTVVGTIFEQGRSQGNTQVQASGYNDGLSNVDVDPSGFVIFTPSNFTIDENAANRNIQLRSSRLNPVTLYRAADQRVRGGLTVNVALSNSNTSAGTIVTNPVVFNPNISIVSTQYDPVAPGVSIISLNTPPGFDTPSNLQQITATVTGP